MDDKWLTEYRVIDANTLLHTPCNNKVEVGMFEYQPETKSWFNAGGDSLAAAMACAAGHELECSW